MIEDVDLICGYEDKCTSKGVKCSSCKKNMGKRNYYERDNGSSIFQNHYVFPNENIIPLKLVYGVPYKPRGSHIL